MKFWDRNGFTDQGTMDDGSSFDGCFQLSRTQRLYGFAICFVTGFVISIMSTIILLGGSVAGFAVLYTLGNIVSLASTGFLIGFGKQIKTMFAPVRWLASVIYIGTMVATLLLAFLTDLGFICLIMCVVQWAALFWYSLSYIPYGRALMKKVFGSCVSSL